MTSANVVEYNIYDKDNKEVGYHRQNVMCSTCNDGLDKYQPSKGFTIMAYGYDEEEDYWQGDSMNLEKWLLRNPASITFRNFEPGDCVKIKRRGEQRTEGVVIETIKGMISNKYNVRLLNGEILNINQNEILPK
jgi:hypothetical protein